MQNQHLFQGFDTELNTLNTKYQPWHTSVNCN